MNRSLRAATVITALSLFTLYGPRGGGPAGVQASEPEETDAATEALPQESPRGLPTRQEVAQRLKTRFRSLFDSTSDSQQPDHLVPLPEPAAPAGGNSDGWNPYRPSGSLPR